MVGQRGVGILIADSVPIISLRVENPSVLLFPREEPRVKASMSHLPSLGLPVLTSSDAT
jgi:hypothetical protein